MIPTPRFSAAALVRALTISLLVAGAGDVLEAQFDIDSPDDGDFSFDEYPTLEGLLAAHRSGRSSQELIAWIQENGAYISLNLDEAFQIHAQGVEFSVIAAMTQVPHEKVKALLGGARGELTIRAEPRHGLSRRDILKLLQEGATDEEVAARLVESGSKGDLSLEEAVELLDAGLSSATLAAIGGAPAGSMQPEVQSGEPPLLDDLLAGAEPAEGGTDEAESALSLDEILTEGDSPEGEVPLAVAATARDADPSEILILSDPPGARVMVAPGSSRPVDLLRHAKSLGRSPARSRLDPGSYYLLVEKQLDPFDDAIIPALRTVHDGEGRTRTLIESGKIYYDAQACCLPRSLGGEFHITRIGADQQGVILGDEFGGLPPYLWDGNRYLILSVEKGRIERIVKVYEVRKAAGERRTIVATFFSSSSDPLLASSPVPPEEAPLDSAPSWNPDPSDLAGMAGIVGIPKEEVPRILAKLQSSGKAVYREDGEGGRLRIFAVSVDSYGRIRVEQSRLERSGPFEMYATAPQPAAARDDADAGTAMARPIRLPDPGVNLPLLSVTNSGGSPALITMGDGTIIFVAAGQTREVAVGPGSSSLEARFADRPGAPLKGHAHFTYHARYKLTL